MPKEHHLRGACDTDRGRGINKSKIIVRGLDAL